MNLAFRFFLRWFIAFLAAQLVLGLAGAVSLEGLLGLSLGLVLAAYIFDLLDWYYGGALSRGLKPAELGWRLARLLIRLNMLPSEEKEGRRPPEPASSVGLGK